jgi:tRNA threonylcarbamoyladenosine biosynthesis protein TsaB
VTGRILSLDTTAEFGSLALVENGEAVEEVLLHSPEGFGHVLFDHIDRLLVRRSWPLDSIDCFAAASGPGSFTGVRVGLAAVKGLAATLGRPVAAVSNLEALASFGTRPLRATVLDARRGEVYAAVYDCDLKPVAAEVVAPLPAWLASLPDGDLEFILVDPAPFQWALPQSKPVIRAPRALAAAIGRIAYQRLLRGLASPPEAIDANYVRRSDAELFWKDGA